MININLNKDQGFAILSIQGPIELQDIQHLTREIDQYIEEQGSLAGLVIKVTKFPGWENLESFIQHVKFIKNHHQKIGKVAFMSESNLITRFPGLANHFVQAELRHFGDGKMDEAVEWVTSEN